MIYIFFQYKQFTDMDGYISLHDSCSDIYLYFLFKAQVNNSNYKDN